MARNDRWRPKQVHRMITPEMRAEAQRREAERQARDLEYAEYGAKILAQGLRVPSRAGTTGSAITCRHNQPWKLCTLCSRPRSAR